MDDTLNFYLRQLNEALSKMDKNQDTQNDLLRGQMLHLRTLELKQEMMLEEVKAGREAADKMRQSSTWLLISVLVLTVVEITRVFLGA